MERNLLRHVRPALRYAFARSLAARLRTAPSPELALMPALLDTAAVVAVSSTPASANGGIGPKRNEA